MAKFKYILSAIFVAFITISLPVMVLITQDDQIIKSENRKVTAFPLIHNFSKREVKDFIEKLNKYVEDRMPFKEYVYQNFARYYRKNTVSADFSRTVEGNDGWLFLGNDYNNVLNQHTRPVPLDEIKQRDFVTNIKEMMAAYPSAYTTVLVCPDKHGIYWENIPRYISSLTEQRLAEKKIADLKENNINVIDLYSALKKGKEAENIYYKTDTHWNPKGAEVGFKEFYRQLSEKINLAKLDFDLYEYDTNNNFKGDLTSYGGYLWLDESVLVFKHKYKVNWIFNGEARSDYTDLSPDLWMPTSSSFVTNKKAPNKLRVFWCGDSFSTSLAPFITLSFENIHYIAKKQCLVSNKELIKDIKDFKPDLIVWQTVERDLSNKID